MVYNTSCAKETSAVAAELALGINKGVVIALHGDMGAGKTVFAKGLIKAMGVDVEAVSPTFALMNEYNGRLKIYHFDLYRLDKGQSEELGFDEFFYEKGAVSLVEWPQKAELPQDRLDVYIGILDDEHRRIEIEPRGNARHEVRL